MLSVVSVTRAGPVLVIGHQAVLRCVYGYFIDEPINRIPHLDVPLHTGMLRMRARES